MDWRALVGSGIVNAASAVLALTSALAAPPYSGLNGIGFGQGGTPGPGEPIFVDPPRFFMISSRRPRPGYRVRTGAGDDAADSGCPRSRTVDRDAVPDFPVFGRDAPLAWLDQTDRSPAYCLLINRRGRVESAFLAETSGDRLADAAILAELRRQRFLPARRDGHAAAAWHRMVVSQPNGLPDARTDVVEQVGTAPLFE